MPHPVFPLVAVLVLLAGCSSTPETRIEKPFTARPLPQAQVLENNGSIFQARQGLFLFEDRRPRQIGDILTVRLEQKTEAKRKSETKDSRNASASVDVPAPTVLGRALPVGATTWDTASNTNVQFKDDETNSNELKGSITVTVVDVLANGHLVVAGEKQVTVNNDTDFIRIAGVINPMHVTREGTVNSTQMADVQFESKSAQSIDKAQFASMAARFFLTLLPF